MALTRGRAGAPARPAAPHGDAGIVVEGLSKQYPRKRVILFPPTLSIFERGWFGRRKDVVSSSAATSGPSSNRTRRQRDDDVTDDLLFDLESEGDIYDVDDSDDLDDDDDGDDEDLFLSDGGDPANPGEMFWALKDLSFRVRHGEALGMLGTVGAGKSTLLSIIGGAVQATEGRVWVRDPVSIVPSVFANALVASSKGVVRFELAPACRLLGIDPEPVQEHIDEIEALAAPLYTEDGKRDPRATLRLSVATAVIVPSNVVLLEQPAGLEEEFMADVADRLRDRLRAGSAVVIASRQAGLVDELCDEALVLSEGTVVDRGDAKSVCARYMAGVGGGKGRGGARRETVTIAPGRYLSEAHELRIPSTVAAFNSSAALMSGQLRTGRGRSKRVHAGEDEVLIEIVLETATPDVEAHCGVTFTPRDEHENGIRLELPEPLRFVAAGTYRLEARARPGALLAGLYDVRADAIVVSPGDTEATVIARDIGRVKIAGDEPADAGLAGEPVAHWDGLSHWHADSEWSSDRVGSRRPSRDGSS